MSRPLIEVLTFEGCPHARLAWDLVDRVVADLGVEASVWRIDVADLRDARAHRFSGSPTIRVNGRDIDPGGGARSGESLACRIYRTEAGVQGTPDERWLRQALLDGPDRGPCARHDVTA